jgi:hypothetical protein
MSGSKKHPGALVVIFAQAALLYACDSPRPRPSPPDEPQAVTLNCADAIAQLPDPPTDYTIVNQAIGLELGRTLEPSRAGQNPAGMKLYAKSGLLVRSGKTAEIRVVAPWDSHARIGWGNPPKQTTNVRIPQCGTSQPPPAKSDGYHPA